MSRTGALRTKFEREFGPYSIRVARSDEDVRQAQRVRFEVFNRELGVGLDRSWDDGQDEDGCDPLFDHLLVEHSLTGATVGTCRIRPTSRSAGKLYSATDFELEATHIDLTKTMELGRVCLVQGHRHGRLLIRLWQSIATIMRSEECRFAIGCYSLFTRDPWVAARVRQRLLEDGHVHPRLHVPARESSRCSVGALPPPANEQVVRIPSLFSAYLKLGAKVLGGPALDSKFRTIDFLVILDLDQLSPRGHKHLNTRNVQ